MQFLFHFVLNVDYVDFSDEAREGRESALDAIIKRVRSGLLSDILPTQSSRGLTGLHRCLADSRSSRIANARRSCFSFSRASVVFSRLSTARVQILHSSSNFAFSVSHTVTFFVQVKSSGTTGLRKAHYCNKSKAQEDSKGTVLKHA